MCVGKRKREWGRDTGVCEAWIKKKRNGGDEGSERRAYKEDSSPAEKMVVLEEKRERGGIREKPRGG